jgi:7-carboxy-7-deazaguanine synthase
MKISEIFESLQGEGRYTGVPSLFVRFAGCNLRCKWGDNICDTPYASYEPEIKRMSFSDVSQVILDSNTEHVVITGGEPSMHYDAIMKLFEDGVFRDKKVTVETNGTLPVEWPANWFISVSPKLKSAGNIAVNLNEYAQTVSDIVSSNDFQLKFVIENQVCVDEMLEFLNYFNTDINSNVYLMPEGITTSEIDNRLEFVADTALKHGFNVTDRLHLRIWGNARGT